MSSKKEKVFKTRITKKLAMLGSIPIATALCLAYFAVDANAKFAPNDPSKMLFVGIPALISVSILASVVLICLHYLNRTITITSEELLYQDSKVVMTLDIAEMAYSPPPEDASFRTLMFSDGETFVQIPEIFLGEKEFLSLTKFIKKLRSTVRNETSQKTYSV